MSEPILSFPGEDDLTTSPTSEDYDDPLDDAGDDGLFDEEEYDFDGD